MDLRAPAFFGFCASDFIGYSDFVLPTRRILDNLSRSGYKIFISAPIV